MKFAVIRFPGSNCDDDALYVTSVLLAEQGSRGRMVWHKDRTLGDADGVIIPGGFSYGDYLRAGAMASHSPVMGAIKEFAEKGGPVLGICNGFQILCESGLLEGGLARNESLRFVCKEVHCMVEGKRTPFTAHIPAGKILRMSVAHAEGRYVHSDIGSLEERGQVLFRYVTADGSVCSGANPNGSAENIAGICNETGNVVGLMPHPERVCEAALGNGSEDGRLLFESALTHFARGSQEAGTP